MLLCADPGHAISRLQSFSLKLSSKSKFLDIAHKHFANGSLIVIWICLHNGQNMTM